MNNTKPVLTGIGGRRKAGVQIRLVKIRSENKVEDESTKMHGGGQQPGVAEEAAVVGDGTRGDADVSQERNRSEELWQEGLGEGQLGLELQDEQHPEHVHGLGGNYQLDQVSFFGQESWDSDQVSWEPTQEAQPDPQSPIETLSQLSPIPESEISDQFRRTPMPLLPELEIKSKQKKGKQKSKRIKPLPLKSTKSGLNKNLSLREEQAEIAKKFKENIAIKEGRDGLKFYQCNLCQEIHFISY